jgi:hypothetical protein
VIRQQPVERPVVAHRNALAASLGKLFGATF